MTINEIKAPFTLGPKTTYALILVSCIILGLLIQWVQFSIIKFSNQRKPTVLITQLVKTLNTPFKFLLPILFIYGSSGILELVSICQKIIESLIIINLSWVIIALIDSVKEVVKEKFMVGGIHQAKNRRVLTQLRFMKSLFIVIIITLASATILWNIPAARKLGTTILTSAGVIGIIAGVAAQKSIANLIVGFQIAFTQPIKIDDEVVTQGEFGTVEDITLIYAVIKTWDWRRLVLPFNYFSDNSSANWTFNSTSLIGSILLYLDYTFPVAELRTKFLALLEENGLWDKKVGELLVTNCDDQSMELRTTFSAKNATDIWNMRCEIREQLISYAQVNYPASLPKLRQMEVL